MVTLINVSVINIDEIFNWAQNAVFLSTWRLHVCFLMIALRNQFSKVCAATLQHLNLRQTKNIPACGGANGQTALLMSGCAHKAVVQLSFFLNCHKCKKCPCRSHRNQHEVIQPWVTSVQKCLHTEWYQWRSIVCNITAGAATVNKSSQHKNENIWWSAAFLEAASPTMTARAGSADHCSVDHLEPFHR